MTIVFDKLPVNIEELKSMPQASLNKPEYGAGSKYDKMFVVDEDMDAYVDDELQDDVFFDQEYDEEEAAYQAELAAGYYD